MTTERFRVPRNGRTIAEAAAITGMSPRSIRRWTSEPREVYEGAARARREKIRAYKAQHPDASMRAIGAALGCSAATVYRALKEERPGAA